MQEPNAPFSPLHLLIILLAPGLAAPIIVYFRNHSSDFNIIFFALHVSVGLVVSFIVWVSISVAWQKFYSDRR